MWTRRGFLISCLLSSPFYLKLESMLWAQTKKILPKGFKREDLKNMNPLEIDNRNLEIDSLEKFGTTGSTDVSINIRTYRLKIRGVVANPLSLSYEHILKLPLVTEVVLLICPGFFAYNAQWTGVNLSIILQEAKTKKEANYVDIIGAYNKIVRIPLKEIKTRKILLAYPLMERNCLRNMVFH